MQNVSTAPRPAAQGIRAELIGSDVARACGIVAHNGAPILELCRLLVVAGHDPDQPLEAWRGDTLALTVRSIGQAAALEVDGRGSGFKRCPVAVATASPVRFGGGR